MGCFRGTRGYVTVNRRCGNGRVRQADKYRERSERGEMGSCVLAHEGSGKRGKGRTAGGGNIL